MGLWHNEHNIVHVLHIHFRLPTPVDDDDNNATSATTTNRPAHDGGGGDDGDVEEDSKERSIQHKQTQLCQISLDFLQTFTVPSLHHQSNQQFLWIMWIDPNLPKHIFTELATIVSQFTNALLLLKPVKPKVTSMIRTTTVHRGGEGEGDIDGNSETMQEPQQVQQTSSRNFRSLNGLALSDLTDNLLVGDRQLLMDYHTASQSRILVESRLHMGDALSQTFVESVQYQAAVTLSPQFTKNIQKIELYCPEDHLEWHPFEGDEKEFVLHQQGRIIEFHNLNFCLSSGISIAYHANASSTIDVFQLDNMQYWPLQRQQHHQSVMEDQNNETLLQGQRPFVVVEEESQSKSTTFLHEMVEECNKEIVDDGKGERCVGQGTPRRMYTRNDLHRESCPSGSYSCRGNNGEQMIFGGPRFGLPLEVVDCKVMETGHSLNVAVKATKH